MRSLSAIDPMPSENKEGACLLRVVIETPRGSRVKYKFDDELGAMALKSVLPQGMAFPFHFGFVPRTLGGDGDPLDVLVLLEEPLVPGCVLQVRVLGAMEVEQIVDGVTERNDRLIAVADVSGLYGSLARLGDVPESMLAEIDAFFVQYHRLSGKSSRTLARRDVEGGRTLLYAALRRAELKFERQV